jgi:hypothetical protein
LIHFYKRVDIFCPEKFDISLSSSLLLRSASNKGHVGRAPADGKNIGKPDSSVSRRRLKRSECGAKNEEGGLRAEFHKYYGGTAQCPPGGHLNKGRMEAKFS